MDPDKYTGDEWTRLIREMTPRSIRNALKRAYRKEAKVARGIAVGSLRSSGLSVNGNRADWEKGIRSHIYSGGGGFLITVKPRGGKSMHRNRAGLQKPVLMWAEEGTSGRSTKSSTRIYIRSRKGHNTGRMPAFRFLERAENRMIGAIQSDLTGAVEEATIKAAKKAGMA